MSLQQQHVIPEGRQSPKMPDAVLPQLWTHLSLGRALCLSQYHQEEHRPDVRRSPTLPLAVFLYERIRAGPSRAPPTLELDLSSWGCDGGVAVLTLCPPVLQRREQVPCAERPKARPNITIHGRDRVSTVRGASLRLHRHHCAVRVSVSKTLTPRCSLTGKQGSLLYGIGQSSRAVDDLVFCMLELHKELE